MTEKPEHPQLSALEAALGARFEDVRVLVSGCSGTSLYLARDASLGRDVCIKVWWTTTDTIERQRLQGKARTAAGLTHANIVPLHAHGDVDGALYHVMGNVHGEGLSERLKRGIDVDAVRRILIELADALEYAHREGVVHGDVRPESVLIEGDTGRAMLFANEFRVARPGTSVAGPAVTEPELGSPFYISPEQLKGKVADCRSDIYSLGVTGYEMLANRLPFEGPIMSVLYKHLNEPPPPLKSVAPLVSDAFVAVIDRCLAKDPERRWRDAKSLREALVNPARG